MTQSNSIVDDILKTYIDAQRELVEVERVDALTTVLSLPLHFSANTRVEIAVTRITDDSFLLSDMAQTIGELQDAGYSIRKRLKDRILEITKLWRIELDGNNLIRRCSHRDLGVALHEFGEAAKTVGDAYLIYRPKIQADTSEEENLKDKIRLTFQSKKFLYREAQSISGAIEGHIVDFYIAPNGSNGLALAVLPNPNRLTAEAWGFKTQDIKNANRKLIVGLVYGTSQTQEISRSIIEKTADISLTFEEVGILGRRLDEFKISLGH